MPMCGKIITSQAQHKQAFTEIIGGTSYTFDSNNCVLMFGIYSDDQVRIDSKNIRHIET